MSFNLKDELAKLSQTAPRLKDSDDEYSDEDTKARIIGSSKDFDDELDPKMAGNKRLRAGVAELDEYGKRYKGKSVSRKELDEFDEDLANELIGGDDDEDEEEDEDDEDDEDGENAEGDSEDQGDEDEDEEDEEDDEEEDGSEDDEDIEDDEEIDSDEAEGKAKSKSKGKKVETDENGLKVVNVNLKEEVAKGKAVKNQLNFWDSLLDTRVKLQNCVNVANQLPQQDSYAEVLAGFDKTRLKEAKSVLKENQSYLLKSLNQLAELQQRLFSLDSETAYMLESDKSPKNLKRKRNGSVDDDEEIDSDEADGKKEHDEDDDDEEIYSDTDEENAANERKRLKSEAVQAEFSFKPLGAKQVEAYLAKVNKNFQKYRNATIQKWYDKTRLVTGKSFESFEKPIMQQIEHLLMDKDRIIRRTQLKRSMYTICAKKEELKVEKLEDLKDRNIKDYDAEIFDDQDFYNQLLRELIDRKSYDVSDPVELSRRAIELQKLRSKNKKVVDTKASKGRKIKFTVHKPMINFMAPIFRCQVPEETRNELFNSLFGGHITMSTSQTNGNHANGGSNGTEVDVQDLFKSF